MCSKPDYLAICLDEMDAVFAHGRDNGDLIRLFNLGYERDRFIGRMSRFSNEAINTPAYCPTPSDPKELDIVAKYPGK
jgi:hypothetical protein